MKTGKLSITYTPSEGRTRTFERTGRLTKLVDGALTFLLRLLK